ncbi:MAG: hypothetical protein LC687_04790 [Actinobacteria bacterium]|nr:hypothetical protein [Actinomycetota bacterium]MCA1807151.1 hypothetical protein [Actinomycetota bacterium]
MVSDILLVTDALKDGAALKPRPMKAHQALEAFERLMSGCGCVDEEDRGSGMSVIRNSLQHVESRLRNDDA